MSKALTDVDTLEHRLRNFAQGCRGSMWQSRDETINLMESAADEIARLKAALPPAVPATTPDPAEAHVDGWRVRVIEWGTDETVKVVQCKGEREAKKIERGMGINMASEYYTEIDNKPRTTTTTTTPDPVSEAAKVPAIPKPNYVQTKPNQWVWNVCEGYEVIITKALGGDQDWSFRVNNLGRCFLTSKEVAMDMAMDALNERITQDVLTLNLLSKGLRALTKDGEAG